MRNDLADILASCLDSLERGERTLEECLALYPEYRAELESLLMMTATLRENADFTPRPSFRLSSRARLLRRLPPRQAALSPTSSSPTRRRPQPMFSKRLALLWTVFLVLAASLVAGETVRAASQALPGDLLFPVKRSLEDARLWLSDDAGDVLLTAQFVQVRVEEIEALAAADREEDLDLAVGLLSQEIAASTRALAEVASQNPQRAAALSLFLRDRLSVHSEVLTSRLETVPEPARQAIEHAINASNKGRETVQDLFGDERPGGGPPSESPGENPVRPDEEPAVEAGEPSATHPGGGPPEEAPGQATKQPGGGPPDHAPGQATNQPGGIPPHGTAGPPDGVPGGRP